MKIHRLSWVLLILLGMSLSGCSKPVNVTKEVHQDNTETMRINRRLSRLKYRPNRNPVVMLNNNQAQLKRHWNYDHIVYQKRDKYGRASQPVTAFLDKRNLADDKLRKIQTVKPTGWHQRMVYNQPILNRGHEIAYSLTKGIDSDGKFHKDKASGDQNDLSNLFTQTSFCNQKLQAMYEDAIKRCLAHGHHVIYQVSAVFGKHDEMPKGVHLQAVSSDNSVDFNVYLFNVQPNVEFNYLTGEPVRDFEMNIPVPKGAPKIDNDSVGGKHLRRLRIIRLYHGRVERRLVKHELKIKNAYKHKHKHSFNPSLDNKHLDDTRECKFHNRNLKKHPWLKLYGWKLWKD